MLKKLKMQWKPYFSFVLPLVLILLGLLSISILCLIRSYKKSSEGIELMNGNCMTDCIGKCRDHCKGDQMCLRSCEMDCSEKCQGIEQTQC